MISEIECKREQSRQVLSEHGYNYALSDVEHACAVLDRPELTPDDESNYHKWAEPHPRRCYCSMVGYTDEGRFYACDSSPEHTAIMKKIFPGWENKFGRGFP